MEQEQIRNIAKTLDDARCSASALPQFSSTVQDFSRSDAYSIQEYGIKLRNERGEKCIGLKMGLTSVGKRQQMNLDSPLYGVLTDRMQIANGGTFNLKGQIHPKIEPEVAFIIGEDLKGEVTREEALQAVSGICAALEILDSRYIGFKYFSMEDVIADNSSSSYFILGPTIVDFKGRDLSDLFMQMKVNGMVATEGYSREISGHPLDSVVELARLLSLRGQYIPKGTIVLTGAATAAIALEVGMQVSLEISQGDFFMEAHVNISHI